MLLSGCVANFCSSTDQANIAYTYEQGVTVYCQETELPEVYKTTNLADDADTTGYAWQPFKDEGNDKLWAYIPVDSTGLYVAKKADYLSNTIINNCKSKNVKVPSYLYFKAIDEIVLDNAIELYAKDQLVAADPNNIPTDAQITAKVTEIKKNVTSTQINPYSNPDCVGSEDGVTANYDSILRNYGYWKFAGTNSNGNTELFLNWTNMNSTIKANLDAQGKDGASLVPDADFVTYYKSYIQQKYSNVRTCIATQSRAEGYGHYGAAKNWSVQIETTSWSKAWSKGLFEGLIVYPVAWLLDSMSFAFDSSLSGMGQIGALILTTIIVRLVVMALTFKGTLDQQKMQALQPQIQKLQQKYPNSKENKAQQARLSQETMALYKRNKVNMFSTFIVLIVQFPVFVSVWGALQGSAVLSTGEVLNLALSDSINSVLTNFSGTWYANTTGWWTALIIFLVMAALQFVAMRLPTWINKKRTKGQTKLSANPAQDQNNKTMKYVSWGMLIFTIVMGFFLPTAMAIYWGIGALMSIAQTAITQGIMYKKMSKKNAEKRY